MGSDSKIVLFLGSLGWKPNAEAAHAIVESIAPRMERETPNMIFLIVGPHPARKLLEEALQDATCEFSEPFMALKNMSALLMFASPL